MALRSLLIAAAVGLFATLVLVAGRDAPDAEAGGIDPAGKAYPGTGPAEGQWWLEEIVNPKATTPPQVTPGSPRLAIVTPGVFRDHPSLAGVDIEWWTTAGLERDREGTAAAGVAAGTGSDQGFLGVWPGMNLSHAASGDDSCIARANAVRLAARRSTEVIVMGYGFGSGECPEHLAATQYAVHRGSVLVAAAGDGGSTELPRPAADPHVISVGSIDRNLALSASSNTGPRLDLVAPGESLLVPWLDSDGAASRRPSYTEVAGSRYAATMVGAAAAWILQTRKDSEGRNLRFSQVRTALTAGARDLGKPRRDDLFGSGLLSIEGALKTPIRGLPDQLEPNEDIGWVNGRLLTDGKRRIEAKPIWPRSGLRIRRLEATLSGTDPADVYRVRIPGRSRIEIGIAQAKGDVAVELRSAGSRTIASPKGVLVSSDLEAPGTEGLAARNRARESRIVYLAVKPGRLSSSSDIRYRITVGRTLPR